MLSVGVKRDKYKAKKLAILSLVTACSLYAGGYKIPEVSTNGVALSAANVAHSHGADAAYYNPANMIFMDSGSSLEADLIYIGLDPVKYKGKIPTDTTDYDINAQRENFFVPSFNYVSEKLANNTRVGLSIVVPGGLSKRWHDAPGKDKAEEFTLEIVEINPTAAFEISSKVAFAVGFRIVHTSGIVKSTAAVSRDMTGDSIDFGYNMALAYKPNKNFDIGVTYRSQVNLTVEGDAKLYNPTALAYDGGGSVSVPLPAALNLAVAYTLPSKTTVEVVYERNFWSAYRVLDFNYAGNIGNLTPYFDDPIAKNWNDVSAYRLGVTQELDELTLMAGAVYDESPVPDETIGFELPDSNSLSVSLGMRYQINEKVNIGVSALYSMRESRTVSNDDVDGEFSNSNVLIASIGLGYKF